jgi:hypothetical protein
MGCVTHVNELRTYRGYPLQGKFGSRGLRTPEGRSTGAIVTVDSRGCMSEDMTL